jgi:DNA repair exonuclease SbcCD ATPase subunit
MLRATFLILSLFSFSRPLPAQTTEPQTRTMEAVLSEIRQLRQDLQAAAVATRKAQIVIYRLQLQADVLERATQRLENTKGELAQLDSQKKSLTEQIKQLEEMKDRPENEQRRKQFEDYLTNSKANLEAVGPRDQELQAKQLELELTCGRSRPNGIASRTSWTAWKIHLRILRCKPTSDVSDAKSAKSQNTL